MTNEELLEQLKQISDLMANDKVIEASENNAEMNNLVDQKEILEKQISELELKLSDDKNYPSFNYLSNRAKLDRVKRSIEDLTLKQERNEANISNDTIKVSQIDLDIESCNEHISQYEQQIDEIGRKLRSLGENPDKDLDKQYSNELKEKREILNELRKELSVYTAERENLANGINSMTEINKTIPASIEKYKELEKTIKETEVEETKRPFDKEKKHNDEVNLAEMKKSLKSIEDSIEYTKYSAQDEMNILIAEIETNSIDSKDIVPTIKKIKSKLPKSLIEKDYDQYESEIEANHSKQVELTSKISDLQTKLSDTVNYTPSVMAIEVMHDEISKIESRIDGYDGDIKYSDYLISAYEQSISSNENEIVKEEEKIQELQEKNDDIKFQMTDSSLSSKDYDDLTKQYNKNKKEIENIRKQIDRLNKNISTIDALISNTKKNKKEIENMKISDTKLLNSQKDSLEDRKTVDKVSILEDQKTLSVLTAQLSALKAEEQMLNFVYYEKLDNIIDNYVPTKDSKKEVKEETTSETKEETPVETKEEIPVETKEDAKDETVVIPTEKEETPDEKSTEADVVVDPADGEKIMDEEVPDKVDAIVEPGIETPTVDDKDAEDATFREVDEPTSDVVVDPAEVEKIMNEDKKSETVKPVIDDERISLDEERIKDGYEYLNSQNIKNLGLLKDLDNPEEKKKPVAIVGWKDASKKLIDKVRDSKFLKKLKKQLAIIGLTGAVAAATIFGLKSCSNGNQNEIPQQTIETTTVTPTEEPTEAPTEEEPTEEPTEAPTEEEPTYAPAEEPTEAPAEEEPTLEPTIEAAVEQPIIAPVIISINAEATDKERFVGDTLDDSDFIITVGYSNGVVLTNPAGWTASSYVLANEGINPIVITYDGYSTLVNVVAQKQKAIATEIRASLTSDGPYYTGTVLDDSYFNVELVMSDGTVISSPAGWTASTRIIANEGVNPIEIDYLTDDNRLLSTMVYATGILQIDPIIPDTTPVVTPDDSTIDTTPTETPDKTPDNTTTPDKTPDTTPDNTQDKDTTPTIDVVLKPGETLIVPDNGGHTAVDNSNMGNSDLISGQYGDDVNYDYPQSEEIGGVTWNPDGSATVTIDKPETTETTDNSGYSSSISKEEQAYLDAFLQEQKAELESLKQEATEAATQASTQAATEEASKGKTR
jgi:hypothetical protein